jgi:hypothetical protein
MSLECRKRNMKTKAPAKAPLRSSKAQQGAQGKYRKVNSLLEEMGRGRTDTLAGLFDEEKEGDDNDDYNCGQEDLNQRLLEKQFEPSLLEEKYLTERDNRIRKSDIPERLQVHDLLCPTFCSFTKSMMKVKGTTVLWMVSSHFILMCTKDNAALGVYFIDL